MNVPRLRFRDDDGREFPGWEEKKLGELGSFFSGGTPTSTNKEFYNGNIPFIKSGEINATSTAQFITEDGLNNSSAKKINVGDLLYALYGATSGTVAISKIEGAINQAILCIRTSLNNYFLYSYLHHKKKIIFETYLQGGQGNLSAEIVKSLMVPCPSNAEQTKIANFLTAIDEKITQLTQKHDLLKQYKKGVMQQIFSQQLRFKDDDGREFAEWRMQEIGNYLVKHEEKSTKNNQYPVLTSSRKGLFFQKDYFNGYDVASKDNTGYNVVPRNYFTYRHMSDDLIFTFNRNNIVDKGIVSTLYPVFTTRNIDDDFLEIILNYGNEFKEFAIQQKQGGSRTYMYFSKLEKLELNLPCKVEQTKIANFLTAIDDKITQTQTQLEAVKQYKKGLLQQMFV